MTGPDSTRYRPVHIRALLGTGLAVVVEMPDDYRLIRLVLTEGEGPRELLGSWEVDPEWGYSDGAADFSDIVDVIAHITRHVLEGVAPAEPCLIDPTRPRVPL